MIMPNYGRADIFNPEEIDNMFAHYKAEVELVSKWIGWLIRKIKDVGIYDDSLIIFTSDHGIYIGEHNRTGKINISKDDPRGPWPLYEEVSHVPLVIKMPGQEFKGKRIAEIIQPTDILPTVLDIAGIDQTKKLPGNSHLPDREVMMENPGMIQGRKHGIPELDGTSVVPLMRGDTGDWIRDYAFTTRRVASFTEGGMAGLSTSKEDESTLLWVTVTGKQYALLLGGKMDDSPELYDLKADPRQQQNIYSENKQLARKMAESLFEFCEKKKIAAETIEAYRCRLT
jgi:arylsulfatase A-like enzyme